MQNNVRVVEHEIQQKKILVTTWFGWHFEDFWWQTLSRGKPNRFYTQNHTSSRFGLNGKTVRNNVWNNLKCKIDWINLCLIWFRPGIYSVCKVQSLSPVASKLNYFKITFEREDEFCNFTFKCILATHFSKILISSLFGIKLCVYEHNFPHNIQTSNLV